MSSPASKPKPLLDHWNRRFWEACRWNQLIAQFCLDAGKFFFPPAPVSPFTGKRNWEWKALSGNGMLWSYVVFHQNYFPGFADEIPYPVLMIKLREGPFLLTNLRGSDVGALKIGQPMKVVFEEVEPFLPHFAPET